MQKLKFQKFKTTTAVVETLTLAHRLARLPTVTGFRAKQSNQKIVNPQIE